MTTGPATGRGAVRVGWGATPGSCRPGRGRPAKLGANPQPPAANKQPTCWLPLTRSFTFRLSFQPLPSRVALSSPAARTCAHETPDLSHSSAAAGHCCTQGGQLEPQGAARTQGAAGTPSTAAGTPSTAAVAGGPHLQVKIVDQDRVCRGRPRRVVPHQHDGQGAARGAQAVLVGLSLRQCSLVHHLRMGRGTRVERAQYSQHSPWASAAWSTTTAVDALGGLGVGGFRGLRTCMARVG